MDPRLAAHETAILRAMTPEAKLQVSQQLRDAAWWLKAAWIRHQHPEWSEARVEEVVRGLFRDAPA